jgi:hypothetical protein
MPSSPAGNAASHFRQLILSRCASGTLSIKVILYFDAQHGQAKIIVMTILYLASQLGQLKKKIAFDLLIGVRRKKQQWALAASGTVQYMSDLPGR